jgi:hypothetical protein
MEAIKVAYDSFKYLTTLNAGSIVLIVTFLKDIFPSEGGTLDLEPAIRFS